MTPPLMTKTLSNDYHPIQRLTHSPTTNTLSNGYAHLRVSHGLKDKVKHTRRAVIKKLGPKGPLNFQSLISFAPSLAGYQKSKSRLTSPKQVTGSGRMGKSCSSTPPRATSTTYHATPLSSLMSPSLPNICKL